MTRVVQFMRDLVAKGMSWDDAACFAERFEEGLDATVMAAVYPLREAKRERDRARYWRNRGETARETGAETVAENGGEIAAESLAESPAKDARIRGEDNLSRLEDKPNLTTSNQGACESDLDWPDGDKPSRAYLDRLEAAVREAGGEALDPTATKLFTMAPILALGRAGKGPPCDLQCDVLPIIRARAQKAARHSISGWDYFTKACLEARDRRMAGAGAMADVVPIGRGQGPPSITAQIGADIAEARRRALEQLSAQNG